MQDYLTLAQVAQHLGLDSGAVVRLLREGELRGSYAPVLGGWLIRRTDLEDYTNGRR